MSSEMPRQTQISSCFPLKLTDFEHYAFFDDSPQHPMVIVMRTLLEGEVDTVILKQAIDECLMENPLLRANIRDGWSPRWCLPDDFRLHFDVIETGSEDPSTRCPPRRIDLTKDIGVQFELRRGTQRSVLVAWFHHVVRWQ